MSKKNKVKKKRKVSEGFRVKLQQIPEELDDFDDFDIRERLKIKQLEYEAINEALREMLDFGEREEKQTLLNNKKIEKKLSKKELQHKRELDAHYNRLKAKFRSVLYANLEVLMEYMDWPEKITDYMVQYGVFDNYDKNLVFLQNTKKLRTMQLVILIYKDGSEKAKWSFIEALRKTRQNEMANIIAQQEDTRVKLDDAYVKMFDSYIAHRIAMDEKE